MVMRMAPCPDVVSSAMQLSRFEQVSCPLGDVGHVTVHHQPQPLNSLQVLVSVMQLHLGLVPRRTSFLAVRPGPSTSDCLPLRNEIHYNDGMGWYRRMAWLVRHGLWWTTCCDRTPDGTRLCHMVSRFMKVCDRK